MVTGLSGLSALAQHKKAEAKVQAHVEPSNVTINLDTDAIARELRLLVYGIVGLNVSVLIFGVLHLCLV